MIRPVFPYPWQIVGSIAGRVSMLALPLREGTFGWPIYRNGRRIGWRTPSPDNHSTIIAPGDRLWVRETVACGACAPTTPSHWAPSFWRREQGTPANPNGLWYRAGDLAPDRPITDRGRWVSGVQMPRWASRLTFDVEEVTVCRLWHLTHDDAEACGAFARWRIGDGPSHDPWTMTGEGWRHETPVAAFKAQWKADHGADSWISDAWIALVRVLVHRCNVDRLPARAIVVPRDAAKVALPAG